MLALLEVQQQVLDAFARPVLPEVTHDRLHGLHRGLQRRIGVTNARVAGLGELALRCQRRLAADYHVAHVRARNVEGDAQQLLLVERRLDEEDVGPGLPIRVRAGDGAIVAFDGAGVGPGDDHEAIVDACVERGLDLSYHLRLRHDGLAVEMPAALGKRLVFQHDRARAGLLEELYRAAHVDRVAESGVGVDHQRHLHDVGHRTHVGDELGDGQKPQVGDAEIAVGNTCAGHEHHLVSRRFDDARGEGVEGSSHEGARAAHEDAPQLGVLVGSHCLSFPAMGLAALCSPLADYQRTGDRDVRSSNVAMTKNNF